MIVIGKWCNHALSRFTIKLLSDSNPDTNCCLTQGLPVVLFWHNKAWVTSLTSSFNLMNLVRTFKKKTNQMFLYPSGTAISKMVYCLPVYSIVHPGMLLLFLLCFSSYPTCSLVSRSEVKEKAIPFCYLRS